MHQRLVRHKNCKCIPRWATSLCFVVTCSKTNFYHSSYAVSNGVSNVFLALTRRDDIFKFVSAYKYIYIYIYRIILMQINRICIHTESTIKGPFFKFDHYLLEHDANIIKFLWILTSNSLPLNSLWFDNAILLQTSWSALVQLITCCLLVANSSAVATFYSQWKIFQKSALQPSSQICKRTSFVGKYLCFFHWC